MQATQLYHISVIRKRAIGADFSWRRFFPW
jgi:hypothetical protein